MSKLKCVALLPMKAHSERVKGKNFREFIDKPLFEWTLGNLLDVEAVDQVVINTDAEDILEHKYEILKHPKVLTRERREAIRGDFVSMNKVIADDLEATNADFYLMTHTTNPLISSATFAAAVEKYLEINQGTEYDSLFSVNRFQSRFYDSQLKAVNHDPNVLLRTQDLPPLYEENSCFYLFNHESFRKTDSRIGATPFLFDTPRLESVDIDDQETWDLAESIYQIGKTAK